MKKIAVFHPEGNINSNPNLCCFCNELAANGYLIDVWSAVNPGNPFQIPAHCNVNLFLTSGYSEIETILSDYSFAIGVDNGILPASRLAATLSIPYAFLSYEIFFDDELNGRLAIQQKRKEKEACKNIAFAIIQDKTRAACLQKEYNIPLEKMLYMPVAGTGITDFKPDFFLHDHLNISHNVNILLHFGSVADWTMTGWATAHADSLPEGWILVIHSKTGNVSAKSNHPKVFYSNLPALPFEKMKDLMQSATCTLALYKATAESPYTGKNLENIGLSSGKISTSFHYGIPVVTNEIGEICELIRTYEAGLVLDFLSDKPFSILENMINKGDYAGNCHRLFSEKLDMRTFSMQINEKIKTLINPQKKPKINFSLLPDLEQRIFHYHERLTLKNQVRSIIKLMKSTLTSLISVTKINEPR